MPSAADLLTWSFDPTIQVPLILSALAYLWAVRRVNRRHAGHAVPMRFVVAFLAGLATIEMATQGVIGAYDDVLFSDHMIQHLLLMMVAPPLLVMGAPITLALRLARPAVRARVLLPLLHCRVVRFLGHPLVSFLFFAGILWVSHFSPLYELSLENGTVHDLEHLAFLSAALFFWWPILGNDPAPRRIPHPVRLVILLMQMVQGAFLGVAILNAPRPLYAHYAGLHLSWITPLADQQVAGAIMWVFGGLIFFGAAMVVLYQWMQAEDAATVRLDARLDREQRLAATGEPAGRRTGD